MTGFSGGEIDVILAGSRDPDDDVIPAVPAKARTRPGDIWQLDDHRNGCGDFRNAEFLSAVVGEGVLLDAAFVDPPYNVKINGNANAKGRHREFAMASGEMSTQEFRDFLQASLGAAKAVSRPGAVHFVCMDWRLLDDVSVATAPIYDELLNVCVWNKSNADGLALSIKVRDNFCLSRSRRAAHECCGTGQAWPQPHQRLGLFVGQLVQRQQAVQIDRN